MKASVTGIVLERAEGPTALCGKPRRVASFTEADAILREWAKTAPQGGGYDKTDFVVTFANGETYTGRYDLVRDDETRSRLLQNHMTESLSFYAGLRRPAHMTEARYQAFLAQADDDKAAAMAFLNTCEIAA